MSVLNTGLAKSSADAAYTIDNSLRFNAADSSYLGRTPGSASNRRTWTMSCWVKTTGNDNGFVLMDAGANPNYLAVYMYQGTIRLYDPSGAGGSNEIYIAGTRLLRDPSAWYHVVVQLDTTESTNTDRVKIYVNNERETAFTQTDWPSEDYESFVNNNIEHTINRTGSSYSDCYMAEYYFIDGTALTPSSFGELDSTTNQWIPIDASGLTFGTNGFYQKYNSTELANSFADSSGGYLVASGVTEIEVLVVAGGGGGSGGGNGGGGGGAGGLVYIPAYTVTPGERIDVTIGAAGTAGGPGGSGGDGGNSVFSGITSVGGGGGGEHAVGRNGGSGGGGWQTGNTAGGSSTQTTTNDGYASTGWGNAGGQGGNGSPYQGGGGGGAGAVGVAGMGSGGISSIPTGGNGGIGKAYTLADGSTSVYYAGGGGAGTLTTSYSTTSGGNGGGGAGGNDNGTVAPTAGTANTGGGGGGGRSDLAGAAGGSGVVIIYDGTTRTTFTASNAPHTITANGDVTNTRAVRKIGDSTIKFDGTGDYLSIPDSTDWSYGTDNLTIEMWVNLSTTSGTQYLWSQITDSNNEHSCYISSGTIYWQALNASAWVFTGLAASTVTVSADVWTHLAFVRNGTTFSIYKDGVSGDSTTSSSAFADLAEPLEIGREEGSSSYINGYLDELRISNSARYTGTFTPQTTAFTADANTMLLIHSNWDGGLGADSSGNYNTFTPTNLVATDQMPDTPTNSFCTLNPLNTGDSGTWNGSLQEGNLRISGTAGIVKSSSTFALDNVNGSYWEIRWGDQTDANSGIGKIGNANLTTSSQIGADPAYLETGYKGSSGVIDTNGSTEATYSTSADGDIVSLAYKAGRLYVGKVASASAVPTWFNSGDPAAGTGYINAVVKPDPTEWYALLGLSHSINFGQDSSFAGEETAQGNTDANDVGDFYGTVPVGFLALCTDNLSAPEIALPGENFNTVLYSGNSTADRAVTGVGFAEDFTWIKTRTGGVENHTWCDVVRGTGNHLRSDSTAAQIDSLGVTSFDSDGFTLPNHNQVNGSGYTYVAWNWKAGGAPTATNSAGAGATPTAGSVKIDGSNLGSALAGTIAATKLSANTTAGFSVVEFTGTAVSGATFAHGLSVAPELVILKTPSEVNLWRIGFNAGTSNSGFNAPLKFRNDAQGSTDGGFFDSTLPSTSVVTLGYYTDVNSTNGMIAYCFHSVEGYSKVGAYTGNGNADGAFIYTGFEPAYVMSKYIGVADDWRIMDTARSTYNVATKRLYANTTAVEFDGASQSKDFLSNGFKIRTDEAGFNASGGVYLYLAFAESPFIYSNAR